MRTEHATIRTLVCIVAMIMFSTATAVYAQTRADSVTIPASPTVTPPPAPPFPIGDPSNASVTVPGKKPAKIRPRPKESSTEKQLSQPKSETVDLTKRGGRDIKSNISPRAARSKGNDATMDPLPASMDPLPALKAPKKKFE